MYSIFDFWNHWTLGHLEHVPVEDVVVGETLPVEQVSEQLPQVTGDNH